MMQNYFDACSSAVTQLSEDDSKRGLKVVVDGVVENDSYGCVW